MEQFAGHQTSRLDHVSLAMRPRANAAMARYAAGENDAFDELYVLLSPRLRQFCSHLNGRAEAEELLQEVLLRMHRARATFTAGGGGALAWSFAIARNTCLDRRRRRRRRPEDLMEQEQLEAHAASLDCCPELCSSAERLERALEAGLHSLSESLRSAYVLVKLEGLSCSEAAEVLGSSTAAIKQRIHRASEELKQGLQQAGW